jgi:diketogulonate reductase-like aldo/keto reductase
MAPIANAHACRPARISLSWLLAKPVVTSVIIGAKRLDQLEENLAAVEVQLTEDELKLLDQVSALRPNIPVGCSPLAAPAVWESLTVPFGTICVSLRARHSD